MCVYVYIYIYIFLLFIYGNPGEFRKQTQNRTALTVADGLQKPAASPVGGYGVYGGLSTVKDMENATWVYLESAL